MDLVAKEAEEYAKDRTTPISSLLEEVEDFALTGTPYPSMLTRRVEGRFLQLVAQFSGAKHIVQIGISESVRAQADSRGIDLEFGVNNIGPISEYTLRALEDRGLMIDGNIRYPIQLQLRDLDQASLIIALHEREHRPQLRERFPQWVDRVQYWNIPDIDLANPDDALSEIDRRVSALAAQLLNGR